MSPHSAGVRRKEWRSALLPVAALVAMVFAPAYACQALEVVTLRNDTSVRQLGFVAIDVRNGACWESSEEDATTRHPPWSTFKIPHLLIALETGAAPSPHKLVDWDEEKRPATNHWPTGWRQSQSLITAFKRSAAWYFQELVPRIGVASYEKWLDRFAYGNQKVPLHRDDFWLGGPLAISAREQARFLACVATTGCGASKFHIDVLESAAQSDAVGQGRLYGKTGSGPLTPGKFDVAFEGWYVGYVRDSSSRPVASFALYMQASSYGSLRTFRQEAAIRFLKQLGLF